MEKSKKEIKSYLEGYVCGIVTACGIGDDTVEAIMVSEPKISENWTIKIQLTEKGILSVDLIRLLNALNEIHLYCLYDPYVRIGNNMITIN